MTKHEPTVALEQGVPAMDLRHATTAYLKALSVEVDADQLVNGLPVKDGALPMALLDRAVARLGHHVIQTERQKLQQADLPCCVSLKAGGYAVIVGLEQGGWRVIAPDCPEAVLHVSDHAFQGQYGGRFFRIVPSLSLLQEKHSVGTFKRHWFWGRLFFQKIRLFDVVVSSFAANLLAVLTSIFVLQVYDRVIPAQALATLWVLALGVGIGILFEALLRVARARLIDQMGKEAEIDISRDLFARVLGMPLDRRPAPPGALVHMVREFGSVKEFFTTAAVGVVADLPFVFVFLGLIYGIAGPVVWVIVAGALLTIIPSFLLQRRMSELSKETMGGMSSASRLLTEAAYGIETLKVTRSEPHFQKQWEEIILLNAVKTTEQRSLSAFLTYWATSMQQVTYVTAVIAGVYMVFAGEFTVGAIIAVSILSTRTLSPITQLSQILSRWQNMKSALEGLEVVMNSEQERDPNRTYIRRQRLSGKIELRKVKFGHPGAKLMGLNVEGLKVEPGVRLALLGANGSGKSTLLRIAAGLYHPNEGDVLIDGMDIRQIDPYDLRRNIGYLPQEIQMHRGTLRENLASDGQYYSDDRLHEALSFGGLGNFVRQHPEGLDAQIGDGGDGLSIGQRQSIGLARLHLLDPSIVLLDEPTAALDQALENELVVRLGQWIGERTSIIATHRPQILSQVHRVCVLQNGQIVLEGPKDAVLKQLVSQPPNAATKADKSHA